jgi:L-ribulokinase
MADVIGQKMPGRMLAPGERAGELCATMARRFGLPAGIPVSAATIDAHAGVPGAGVGESGAMVLVMGTSSCHMLNAKVEHLVPGVAGVVDGGILPGHFGYETGQAAVGDAFDWLRRTLGRATFAELDAQAAALAPGADGVVCLDWFNGCRTPLMDGSLTGAFTGLTLNHGPHHLYRALLEASAFGVRWIVDTLRDGGVPVKRFVATGGLPHHNPLLVQIYADVLGAAITVHPCRHGPALGAAILGALAAGPKATGFTSARTAVKAMADPDRQRRNLRIVKPDTSRGRAYAVIYDRYRRLAEKLR